MLTIAKRSPKKTGGSGRVCHIWITKSEKDSPHYYRVSACGQRKEGALTSSHTDCSKRGCNKCPTCLSLSDKFQGF